MLSLSLNTLQIYWWFIISLLGGLLVFMMFVQGGQSLLDSIAHTSAQKDLIINSLGRKWEITFTTLVLFGGACFAAFPLFYSTSFGGAYWVWLAILFCFIIQAVSYEYRRKKENFLGQRTYETFLKINGTLGTILIGIAVATFFSGSNFSLNERNFVIWGSAWRGLEALKDPFVYMLGLSLFFLARIGGSMYLMNNIDDDDIYKNSVSSIKKNTPFFLIFFVVFAIWLLLRPGFSYDLDGVVSLIAYKYALNFIAMPGVLVGFALGVGLVLAGIVLGGFMGNKKSIFIFGFGVVITVFCLFLLVGLNHTPFYPSYSNLQSSLTIQNASSSHYTLGVMSYVSLIVPFVLAYIVYVWYCMDRQKLTLNDLENQVHKY